jgi:HK97 gp10 family phage protein
MVQGLSSLRRKLRNLPVETRRRLQADLNVIGRELNVEQRGRAPVEDGDLKSTIRTDELGGDRIGVAIRAGGQATTKPVRNGADVTYDYAMAQEFGTEDMAPNPFFYGPYRLARRKIKRRATAAIKKAARSI